MPNKRKLRCVFNELHVVRIDLFHLQQCSQTFLFWCQMIDDNYQNCAFDLLFQQEVKEQDKKEKVAEKAEESDAKYLSDTLYKLAMRVFRQTAVKTFNQALCKNFKLYPKISQ